MWKRSRFHFAQCICRMSLLCFGRSMCRCGFVFQKCWGTFGESRRLIYTVREEKGWFFVCAWTSKFFSCQTQSWIMKTQHINMYYFLNTTWKMEILPNISDLPRPFAGSVQWETILENLAVGYKVYPRKSSCRITKFIRRDIDSIFLTAMNSPRIFHK